MSAKNWQRNFLHYSSSESAVHPSVPNPPMALVTIFVEMFSKKNFGEVLDLYQLPHGKKFEYLAKNGVLKVLERVFHPVNFSGACSNHQNASKI